MAAAAPCQISPRQGATNTPSQVGLLIINVDSSQNDPIIMSHAGLTACGGYQTQTTCHTLIAGQWEQSATLVMARFDHVSWSSANGTFLMGGSGDARQTSERLNNTDTNNSTGFNLQYDTMYAIYVLSQNSQVATMHML